MVQRVSVSCSEIATSFVSNAHQLFNESVQVLPVRHMQTVFPALYQSANDLQVVAENCLLGVEAVLHQEL